MQAASAIPGAATWQDDLRLGWAPIDTIHEEFVELLAALRTATEESMTDALAAVHQHSREHFASEERWMEETDFPARACHADEHAAVLASMEGVARRVAAGDFEAGRRLTNALVDWFPAHAEYLDSALAHWMCKKRLGGKPIVLRRSAAVPTNA